MENLRRMFGKKTTSRAKKDKASTSTPTEMCDPPRASTGGGGTIRRRRRESPIIPGRASSAETSRDYIDQSEVGDAVYKLQAVDDNSGRRITKQYTRIANFVPTNYLDFNAQGNLYDLRGNWAAAGKIYRNVITNYPEVKHVIDQTGWSQLWQLEMPKSDHKLVAAIIQRWSNKTHTFHLPMVEVGITPFDFTFVTGISSGVGPPVPEFNEQNYINPNEVIFKYFPGMPSLVQKCKTNALPVKCVKEYLTNELILTNTEPHIIARIFCFFVIGYVFFPNGANYIPFGMLSLVEDIHNIGTYDWGSAILARVYYGLDQIVPIPGRKRAKSVDCFWQIIEYVMYEYLATSCPQLKVKDVDTWPRIHRWVKTNREKLSGLIMHNFPSAQQQIELRSPNSIIWRPYLTSELLKKERQLELAYRVSIHRHMLLDPQNGATWYLGERCVRQLRNVIGIPDNPPEDVSNIPRDIYFQHVTDINWPSIDEFYVEVDQIKYDEYWAKVSGVRIIPPLMRYTNTDAIGTAAVLGMDVTLPCIPPDPNTLYPTQPSSSSYTQYANIDWNYRVATVDAGTKEVEVERPTGTDNLPPVHSHTIDEWRIMYGEALHYGNEVRNKCFQETMKLAVEIQSRDLLILELRAENDRLRGASAFNSGGNAYIPSMSNLNAPDPQFTGNFGFPGFGSSSNPSNPNDELGFGQFASSSGFAGLNTESTWHGLDQL